MEEFYNNPFRCDPAMDEVCYASVQFLSPEALPVGAEGLKDGDFFRVSSALRFQSQLSEALRANSTLRSTYEVHIETQRREIDRLGDENNELQKKLTRMESQLRSVTLEKECSEMAYKRESEKNVLLEEKVRALENELNSVERRTRDLRAAFRTSPQHSDEHEKPSSRIRPLRLQQSQYSDYQESRTSSPHRNNRARYSLEATHMGPEWSARHSEPQEWRAAEGTAASKRSETTNSMKMGSARRDANYSAKGTAYPTQNNEEDQYATVKELERRLLQENQAKDEIEKQLQKIECTRIRTGAERAKKIALERNFLAAQRTVGEIRMRLRSLAALVR
ncbi:hypothetical protein TraAM80_00426 [Trypanosoma rangeli]|uniref:Uncharacterized protein n=1 Tax=Trypanosoma rangeli TaxID=5698 RepID=A0A422P3J4_TRYRA|nr:uncharacterized protein TraAM80_00426 [Trypanosoma rangeli]RNF12278.1 hypothetical protein TraAM80_00426 [Trypanosoma rangeli]|eukprot:RNF12278.1 hypothetical protein TraAM80_00426 [Trypanosoma rangeli]